MKEYERRHKSYSRNSYEATYRMKGLIRCSSCGSTLCRATPKYLQCHRYAKGQCAISHHLSLELANAAIEEALEQAIATGNYNLRYKEPRKTTNVVDFKKMLEKEEHKLEKIREAYESGIDSLQEYAKRKEHIISNIATLKKEAKAQSSDSTTAEPNRAAFKKKLTSVLKTLRSPRFTEQQKNEALSQILEKAIYSKSTNTFQLFFYT